MAVKYLRAVILFVGLARGKASRQDTFDEVKNRLKFAFRGLMFLPYTLKWLNFIGKNPMLCTFIERRPRVASKLHRPYMLNSLGVSKRLQLLVQHYNFQCEQMPLALSTALLADEYVVLAKLLGKNDKPYSIILTQRHSFEKEGELSLRVIDEACNNLATLSFSFYEANDVAAVLIGGLQGPPQSRDHTLIKEATKACHGLFPKKLVVEALLDLARQLGIDAVHAVAKEAHIYNHWRYRREFHADYNQFWVELGAEKLNNQLYKLPSAVYHKPLAEVESKKRSEYARRYALLAEISVQMAQTVTAS